MQGDLPACREIKTNNAEPEGCLLQRLYARHGLRGKPSEAYQVSCRECLETDCYTEGVGNTENRSPHIVVVVSLIVALAGIGARSLAAGTQSDAAQVAASPVELVRFAVAHEVAAANDSSTKHMFRSHKQTLQGSQTRLYVETQEAMAGMTIAYNDQPLTPEQMQGEKSRLTELAGSPEQLRRKHSQEQETADRTLRIVKALPDAFLYDYDGEEKGTMDIGKDAAPLVRLKFRPNPEYRPPSHVEDVLTGMQGFLLIDSAARRIARIDGTLFKEVGFGWGILGHLDKGGHFLVEQRDVGDDSWEVSRMSLIFTGKILLFKSLAIKSEEVFSNFRRVPDGTTFAQGVEILEAEEAKLAENQKPGAAATDAKSH
jgi:hypothetical protein